MVRWLRSSLARLPDRLRGFYLVNLFGLTSSLIALAIATPLVGSHRMAVNVYFLLVAEVILLCGLPGARRFGARAVVYAVLAASVVFVTGAVLVTPFLTPLLVLLLIAPVLLGVPYLQRREMFGLVLVVVCAVAFVAAFGTYRLDLVRDVPTSARVLSLALSLPVIVSILAYEVVAVYLELTQQTAALRESRRHVVDVANAARRSLERDLHDGAQQQLVGLSVQVARARTLLDDERDPELLRLLDDLQGQVLTAIAELRELARGIYPPLLAERGLNAALHAAARRSTLPCTLLAEPIGRQDPAIEAAVYFCILEALQNAAKHSGAREVTLQIRAEPRLEFAVMDDGCGFDPEQEAGSGGLLGMRARVSAAGGRVYVESRPGVGTTIRARFPRVSER